MLSNEDSFFPWNCWDFMDQVHAWYLSGPTLHLSLVIYIMLFLFSQSNNDALDNKLMVPRDSSGLNDLCTDRRIGFAVFFFFSLFCIWVWKNWCKNIWCGLISTSTYKLSEFVAYYLLAFMRFCMILELIGCVLVILSLAGDQPFYNGGKEQWW